MSEQPYCDKCGRYFFNNSCSIESELRDIRFTVKGIISLLEGYPWNKSDMLIVNGAIKRLKEGLRDE
jgi:hypothetical protein